MVRLYLALSETGILSSKVSVLFRIATSNEWEFLLPTFNVDFFICILYFSHSNRCVKVKVAQLCLTLCHPMDYTVHGQNTGVGTCSLPQGTFPIQESNPGLLLYRQILYQLRHQRSPVWDWFTFIFKAIFVRYGLLGWHFFVYEWGVCVGLIYFSWFVFSELFGCGGWHHQQFYTVLSKY